MKTILAAASVALAGMAQAADIAVLASPAMKEAYVELVPRFDTLLDIVRVLDLDLLLVPRSLVPAVQSLIRAQKEPESAERPLYAADDEELAPENRHRDEF